MKKWRPFTRFMTLIKEVRESERELRFGLRCLSASEIAEQFYCEKKVELKYIYGRIQTEEMKEGEEKHEETLFTMVPVEREKLWKDILQKPEVAASMLLIGKYGECVIAGKPDYMLFRRRKPVLIIEHKFSRKPRIFPQYHVQALVYGYLLHDLGFDTSELRYIISVVPPDRSKDELWFLNWEICHRAMNKMDEKRPVVLDLPGLSALMYPFSLESAIEKLEWAIPFWEGKRNAKPTRKPEKCRVCEYRKKCVKSADTLELSSYT